MSVCFTASRLMKASEVRRFCQKARENRELLSAEEKNEKKLYKRFCKRKTASVPTLAIITNQPVQSQYSIFSPRQQWQA